MLAALRKLGAELEPEEVAFLGAHSDAALAAFQDAGDQSQVTKVAGRSV